MKKRKFFLIIIACAILQVTVLDDFRFFWVKPDLLLICVVFSTLYYDRKPALFFSLAAGLLKDVLSQQVFGLNMLSFPLWSILIMRLSKEISLENKFVRMFLMCVVSFGQAILGGIVKAYFCSPIPFGVFVRIVFISCLYTTLCFAIALETKWPAILKKNQP
jgi:rod shape-determining protein MreD